MHEYDYDKSADKIGEKLPKHIAVKLKNRYYGGKTDVITYIKLCPGKRN